ncbi:MAG TPA: hypothetical protein VF832_16555 [Longimicrobiales bacterium]
MVSWAVLAVVLVAAPQQGGSPEQPLPRFPAVPFQLSAAPVAPGAAPLPMTAGAVPARPAEAADTPLAVVPAGASPAVARPVPLAADTPVRRPRAVEYSDWYARRLAIHRVASYTLLPLLGLQYYTGTQLMSKGSAAPDWVIRLHAPLATTSAVVFGANTVTGLWNLWDARKDPHGRTSRTVHGLLMLVSDAGFLAAGSMGHRAVQDASTRSLHRTIALSSMGAALVSYAIMLPPFRR